MAIRKETFAFANSLTHEQVDRAMEDFLRNRGRCVEKRIERRTPSKTFIVLTYEESRSGEHLPPQTTVLR